MLDLSQGLARWRGKVVLITGASAGIGRACTLALAASGLRVAVTARRADRLESLAGEVRALGAETLVVPADLSTVEGPHQVFEEVRAQWGGVDVLVNNAGVGRVEPIATVDWAVLQQMLDVNVRAATLCIREALQDMAGRTHAQIVNLSSLAGHRVPPGRGNVFYAATKHALKALTDGVRMELVAQQSPIRIGMISPGMVESEFHDVAAPDGHASAPAFQMLKADDIASALLYLLAVPPHVAIHDIVMRPAHQVN